MKEILILSGKGGTGKTSVTGSLAALITDSKVLADCDVDAADLHLLLAPRVAEEHDFVSGVLPEVAGERCVQCGLCAEQCAYDAITMAGGGPLIDPLSCEGCGVCGWFCPEEAITMQDTTCGVWLRSTSKYGPMLHAALHPGEENSGKLVSLVKREARELAEAQGADWLLTDGPPGIGCPVIASLSGADMVLAVTEPSASGLHDLERLLELAAHFKVKTSVCINKWDLNKELSQQIAERCQAQAIPVLARIPFAKVAVESVVQGVPLVEWSPDSPAAQAMGELWAKLSSLVGEEEDGQTNTPPSPFS
ncbi:MAG: ATP-binding protein [Thermodesulfobacteriota bacterium]